MPTVLFTDQMVDAFPNAKIILTETSPEAWVKSMEKSFYSIINDNSSMLLSMDTVSYHPQTPTHIQHQLNPYETLTNLAFHPNRITANTSSPSSAAPSASGPATTKTTSKP